MSGLIMFDERTAADLQFVGKLSPEHLSQFCNVALEFIKKGADKKMFARAAAPLGASPEAVENGVIALAQVLIETSKNQLLNGQFMLSAADLPLGEEHKKALWTFYTANSDKIKRALASIAMALPEYQHLDWRLDVEVGSRLVHQTIKPAFTLRVDTIQAGRRADEEGSTNSHFMQCDYATLKRLQTELELAIAEMKTPHCSRMSRYIK